MTQKAFHLSTSKHVGEYLTHLTVYRCVILLCSCLQAERVLISGRAGALGAQAVRTQVHTHGQGVEAELWLQQQLVHRIRTKVHVRTMTTHRRFSPGSSLAPPLDV